MELGEVVDPLMMAGWMSLPWRTTQMPGQTCEHPWPPKCSLDEKKCLTPAWILGEGGVVPLEDKVQLEQKVDQVGFLLEVNLRCVPGGSDPPAPIAVAR